MCSVDVCGRLRWDRLFDRSPYVHPHSPALQPNQIHPSTNRSLHHPQDEGKFGVRALLDLSLGLVAPSAEQQQDGEGDEASFDCPGKRTPFLLLEDVFDVLGVAQVEVRSLLCGVVSGGPAGRTIRSRCLACVRRLG